MLIGFSLGRGANNPGCSVSPTWLKHHPLARKWLPWWTDILLDSGEQTPIEELSSMWPKLASLVEQTVDERGVSVTVGGDHTTALGTWNGLRMHSGRTGLIWIDAHLDSHTPESSHSGNLHGMPLAALLGYGDRRLTGILPCLRAEDVCVIGARDFEPEEPRLLGEIGVRVIYGEEIRSRSIASITDEALSIAACGTDAFGVSVDLDVIDPVESPGVGCPAAGGISMANLNGLIEGLLEEVPRGWEIVEYNPFRDQDDRTLKIIVDLLDRISRDHVLEPSDRSVGSPVKYAR